MSKGIYKIVSPTERVYIGQTINWRKRRRMYNSATCKGQRRLYNSLIRHGVSSHTFEMVHELPEDVTQEVLDNYEILYWQQYKDLGLSMLNTKYPGSGGQHSEETKRKMSTYRKNTPLTPKQLEHLDNLHKTTPQKNRGKKRTELFCEILSKRFKGKTRKGTAMSEETKEKLRQNLQGRKSSNKPIRCIETGIEYKAIKEVVELIDRTHSTINYAIKNKRKICGLTFELI